MIREIKDTINVRVRNNTAFTQNVNILGGTADPLGVPPSLLYQWDLSTETYFGSVTATIVISNTSNPTPVTYTVQVNGYNIQSVAFALNTLNLGVFQISGNIIYVSNDFYIYGALSVVSNLFNSVWNTNNISVGSSAFNQIHLPLEATGTYDFTVDWGDGSQDTITSWNQAETTHTYAVAGTYNLSIAGTISGFNFFFGQDEEKILSISNFGTLQLGNNGNYFAGCLNLDLSSVTDILDFTGVTNCSLMFYKCQSLSTITNVNSWDVSSVTNMDIMFGDSSFNDYINDWDTSSVTTMVSMFNLAVSFNTSIDNWNVGLVTNMNAMFDSATSFNQPLNSWNTISVTNMSSMFNSASAFNGNISSWNVSNVTNMNSMFLGATSFNGNITAWNTVNVQNMLGMFQSAISFNQSLNSWNTGSVTNMNSMFLGATSFNGNITSWNVSSVTNMQSMFSTATSFNQPIGSWNTGSVTDMQSMFVFASNFNQSLNSWNTINVTDMSFMFLLANNFNGNITSWNTSNVTTMRAMFSTSGGQFNQNISGWNVSNVTNFADMFTGATSFNQPIGIWNTGSSINMSNMFFGATAFNQDIGAWNVSSVTNFSGFMSSKSFTDYSALNLDSIYNGWSLLTVQPNISINFGTIKYTVAGQAGKNILDFAPNNWTIVDGGI